MCTGSCVRLVSGELFKAVLFSNTCASKTSFALLSPSYFIILPLFLKNANIFIISSSLSYVSFNNNIQYNYFAAVTRLLKLTSYLKFTKMSFAGKGYRLVLGKRHTITFSYGHSHLYYIYFFQIKPRKDSKTKLTFFGLNTFTMRESLYKLFWAKPINIFTWRGVRFQKQKLRKKVGKVSLYF